MEKKFYTDNFEQLLKETTDNFRMYPSKRVWHSIYNNLHPSRKWPSMAVCLLFVTSILYIGIVNRSEVSPFAVKQAGNNTVASTEVAGTNSKQNDVAVSSNNRINARGINKNEPPIETSTADLFRPSFNEPGTNQTRIAALTGSKNPDRQANASPANKNDQDLARRFIAKSPDNNDPVNDNTLLLNPPVVTNEGTLTEPGQLSNKKDIAKNAIKKQAIKVTINSSDKEWIEDFAFHNKPFASKWKTRVTYQLYATPSVGYRTLSKNTSFNPGIASSSLVANTGNTEDYESALSQAAAVNMELGGNILYSISKMINLKLGVQFNYSNYNINAYELKHPTMTTLMLNDLNSGYPTLVSRPSTLANIEGVYTTKLNNNSYQISLPMGADIKLAGKNNLKWFAGATIQPTYIAGGNAYLVSSDLKNYVDGNAMMRTWNLNAGVETFITYKTKSGIILNAGPQFRYQLLSTLTKEYTYDEKLYNLGLKFGIITKF